jgi:hypothetical protein
MGQWSDFDPLWRKLLKKNGLGHFHSKSMRQSKGQFRGWRVADETLKVNVEIVRRLADELMRQRWSEGNVVRIDGDQLSALLAD